MIKIICNKKIFVLKFYFATTFSVRDFSYFLSLKNDVNVASKSKKQKNLLQS